MSKLIDEKGRIFGKINVVDMLVIAVIVVIIGALVYRVTSSSMNAEGTNILMPDQDIYVKFYANAVVPEVVDALKVGDKLINSGNFTNAEIVSVDVTPAAYITTNSEGEPLKMEHPMWYDIMVVVKDTANPSSPILKVANQEVRVNYTFLLKTQTFEVNCRIREIEFK